MNLNILKILVFKLTNKLYAKLILARIIIYLEIFNFYLQINNKMRNIYNIKKYTSNIIYIEKILNKFSIL